MIHESIAVGQSLACNKLLQTTYNDKTATSWKKVPFGLVRENTSGVTLFTLLFWGREGDPGIPKLLTTSK